jgi:putative RecB family exonuclease
LQYSHSRLSSYENCPKQYHFRYVEKIKTEWEGVEAYLGKRVHEILERLYHHVARYLRPPSLGQVQRRFQQDWQAAWHERVRIVRDDRDQAFYVRQGERCLENYYRSHYPFDRGETVALEHEVELTLDPEGRYRLRGIIDRVVRTGDGCYEIHDYKTGSRLPTPADLERDRQLALYQIGIQQARPEAKEVALVWHYLAFNKTLRSQRSAAQLAELREATIGRIQEIESAQAFPPRPGPLCRWCEFNDLCPAAGGRELPPEPPPPAEPPVDNRQDGRGQLALF